MVDIRRKGPRSDVPREDPREKVTAAGMISWAHFQTTSRKMFGATTRQTQGVSVRVHEGEVRGDPEDRGYSPDRIGAGRQLIDLEMTADQWARFLISGNRGEGIPCTFRWRSDGPIDPVEFETETEQFGASWKSKFMDLLDLAKGLRSKTEEHLSTAKTTAADRKEIQFDAMKVHQALEQNIPYLMECFAEQMERVVMAAKADVDQYVHTQVEAAGLAALPDMSTQHEHMDSLVPPVTGGKTDSTGEVEV
jgi:hypothetical protein